MAGIPLFQAYFKYEDKLSELVDALQPLLDSPPPNMDRFLSGSLRQKWGEWTQSVKPLVKVGEIWRSYKSKEDKIKPWSHLKILGLILIFKFVFQSTFE